MIQAFTNIENLFIELNNALQQKTKVYIIGGAALLKRGMKTATKDIDIVVADRTSFLCLQNTLKKMKFLAKIPTQDYAKLNLSQILERNDYRIDLFEKQVCGEFCLSDGMMARGEKVIELSNISVYLCSSDDIFLFKTMTEREGDLTDCISIATTQNPNWDVILDELKHQIMLSKKQIWITWVGERLDILVERGLDIPIMKEIDKLREAYFDELEKVK